MVGLKPLHNRKSPRSWTSLFFAMGGWLCFVALLMVLVATGVSIAGFLRAERFEAAGVEAVAEVVSRRIDYGSSSDDSDDYYVTLRFDTGAAAIQRERQVKRSFYASSTPGGSKTIRYLPDDPGKFEYYVGEFRDKGYLAQVVAGIAGAIGILGLWFFGRKATGAILARQWGVRTTATIESFVERKNSGRPTGRGYMIWKTRSGQRGESMDRKIDELRRFGVGAQIVIYERDGQSWWEGDVGPRSYDPSSIPKVGK